VTCRAVADFILEYLSGELAPAVRDEFDRHLAVCPNCQRYIALYQASTELSRRVFADDEKTAENASVPKDLIDAIIASRPR
jgi:anti-sigma factor RsiW